MNDLYEPRNSNYCYENSDVLKNKLNIKEHDILEKTERKIASLKLYVLQENKQIAKFDIQHFLSIHAFIFEDIYYFAGKIRTENIAKGNFRFAEWQYIENELKSLLERLKREKYLKGLSKTDLAFRLSYYMSEINVLHPFREGNGRTIREFIRQLAYINNYYFDINQVTPNEMLNASIKSVTDTSELEKVILKCLIEI